LNLGEKEKMIVDKKKSPPGGKVIRKKKFFLRSENQPLEPAGEKTLGAQKERRQEEGADKVKH